MYCWMQVCIFFKCVFNTRKDSNTDLGVIFWIVQNLLANKANFKKKFFRFAIILIFLRESKEVSFFTFWINETAIFNQDYSIVKNSNADLGVIFRFLQNSHITKAVCTQNFAFLAKFWYFWEKIRRHYF